MISYLLIFGSDDLWILLKISSHEIGTIPLFAPYPTIEYDLPAYIYK